MKALTSMLVVLLLGLQGQLIFGQGGLLDQARLREAVKKQHQVNEQLKARNGVLMAEVLDLKKGLAAIEEKARSELGMLRRNETFYQYVPSDSAAVD